MNADLIFSAFFIITTPGPGRAGQFGQLFDLFACTDTPVTNPTLGSTFICAELDAGVGRNALDSGALAADANGAKYAILVILTTRVMSGSAYQC